jgi:hypothetical protein
MKPVKLPKARLLNAAFVSAVILGGAQMYQTNRFTSAYDDFIARGKNWSSFI